MTINPNNYLGAANTLVGYLAGPAQSPAFDKDGSRGVLEVSIPINEGYKKDGEFVQTGTTWYRYQGAGDFAQNTLAPLNKGDKVRIDGAKQEVREYTDREGNKRLGITLTFGTLQVLEPASGGAPAGGSEETPF